MTVSRNSLREQVRDWLLQRIGSGELAPGDRVMEGRVAGELQVSPIPVREAIRELVAMNVLEAAPNKGAWVRRVSIVETIEALCVRSALEPLAVRLAGEALSEHCSKLTELATAIVRAAEQRDFAAFQKHNQEFHRAIVVAAGSSVLLRVWDSLTFEVGARSVIAAIPHADPSEIAKEHQSIAHALASGDLDRACALLGVHALGLV
ncbi:MAG: GntR family transcriptional regulator, partial [bacterium]|nr:GntR family transcriptional regulator [bacterium]